MENLLIYGSIFDMLDELTNEEAGLLFKALNSFRKGEEVEFDDRYLRGIWKGIKPNLDKLKENYSNKVKANQENGKKGGRPKKSTEPTISTQPIQDIKQEEIVSEIEDNEEYDIFKVELEDETDKLHFSESQLDAIDGLKDLLIDLENGEYVMKTDIERKLVLIFSKTHNNIQIETMSKEILKNKITQDKIEDYLLTKI